MLIDMTTKLWLPIFQTAISFKVKVSTLAVEAHVLVILLRYFTNWSFKDKKAASSEHRRFLQVLIMDPESQETIPNYLLANKIKSAFVFYSS